MNEVRAADAVTRQLIKMDITAKQLALQMLEYEELVAASAGHQNQQHQGQGQQVQDHQHHQQVQQAQQQQPAPMQVYPAPPQQGQVNLGGEQTAAA